ncbi:MAG: BatD family protein [Leptospira sp.]|nr:BatD family protein [Leptospira sp.]
MRSFGKFFFLLLLHIISVSLNASDLSFELDRNRIEAGDVIILNVIHTGDKKLNPTDRRYISKNVQVYFLGNSFETKIINFKVTRSSILKYQISSDIIGKHEIPNIKVNLDDEIKSSPNLVFEVIPKQKITTPKMGNKSIFDEFFGDLNPSNETGIPPEVAFHTNTNICYIGEPIIGYYVLYYNDLRQPYLERDPNQSISFPFFISETIDKVTVQINPTVNRSGIERNTLVYLKEIYGLTPLKAGNLSIGATNFVVGDSLKFGALHESLSVKEQKVTVLPLPLGSPKYFSGAIGEYDLSLIAKEKAIGVGESFYFSIRVFGKGAGNGIKDPLQLDDSHNNGEIHLIKKDKSKSFRKLESGEYGFYSENIFQYSFESKTEGIKNLPQAALHYFSPSKHSYESKFLKLPTITVKKYTPNLSSNNEEGVHSQPHTSTIVISISIGFSILIIFFGYLLYIKKIKITEQMIELGQKIGSKRGDILKDFLIRHGISESDASTLKELSLVFQKESWSAIYKNCSKSDRNILIHTFHKLKGESYDNRRKR